MSVVLPFRPQIDMGEDLLFLTSITRASFGNENRVSNRQKPRRVLDYTFIKSDRQVIASVNKALLDSMGGFIDLPIWPDVVKLRGLALGATTITTGTRQGDFRDGNSVMLWKNDLEYESLVIDSSTSTTLTFTTALTIDYPLDVLLAPVLASLLVGSPRRSTLDNHDSFTVKFEVVDNVELTGGVFDYTFESDPVWGNCNITTKTQINEDYRAAIRIFDNQTGIPAVYRDSDFVQNVRTMEFWLEDQEQVQELREQCHALKGRFKRFWLPDHASRMELKASALTGAATIIVSAGEYESLFTDNPVQRSTLYVSDGSLFQAIGISGVTASALDTETITLDGTLDFGLDVGNSNIGFLVRHRLNTDRIHFKHGEQSTVSLSAMEVTGE